MVADELGLGEAHGTGTALGDPIEASAVAAAIATPRSNGTGVVVSSIKANLGHGESTAGATGLLKLALGLGRVQAAPNALLRLLNPHVGSSLRSKGLRLSVQAVDLGSRGAQAGGVSSFGYAGTIAHAVLRLAPGWEAVRTSPVAVQYKRRAFRWRDVQVPLAKARKPERHTPEDRRWLYAID
eukprot:6074930-Prymnesium_polylepis.1